MSMIKRTNKQKIRMHRIHWISTHLYALIVQFEKQLKREWNSFKRHRQLDMYMYSTCTPVVPVSYPYSYTLQHFEFIDIHEKLQQTNWVFRFCVYGKCSRKCIDSCSKIVISAHHRLSECCCNRMPCQNYKSSYEPLLHDLRHRKKDDINHVHVTTPWQYHIEWIWMINYSSSDHNM